MSERDTFSKREGNIPESALPTCPAGWDCKDDDCENDHGPMPPAQQAAFDAKVKVQSLSLGSNEVLDSLTFALNAKIWGLVHEAFALGLDAGRVTND
jgi:hypothetical protein